MNRVLTLENKLRLAINGEHSRTTKIDFVGQRGVDEITFPVIEIVVADGSASRLYRGLHFEPEAARLREQAGILCLDPVGNRDVNFGFAGPRLVLNGFDDGAGLDNVVESADTGLVVADVLCADESGTA